MIAKTLYSHTILIELEHVVYKSVEWWEGNKVNWINLIDSRKWENKSEG